MSGISAWADYYVRAVRYNEKSKLIEVIRVRPDNGGILGEAQEVSRAAAVKLIEAGVTFMTTPKDSEGRRFKGKHVYLVEACDGKYIRTDLRTSPEDELGDLPVI